MNTINRSAVIPFAILAMWATNGASSALAEQSAQPAFASAAEASQNLFQAVQSNNEQAIIKILGGPTELTKIRSTANCSSKNTRRCTAWAASPTAR